MTLRTCLACGTEGRDVAMVLIDHDDPRTLDYLPVSEQPIVSVPLVSAETNRGITGFDYPQVRERYISEPRCRDKAACAARMKAMEVPAPAPADAEEGPSWLL